ncbi:alpha/beta hydrolase [Marinimicrobium agarilyticum]|uniref:alpha/beta hydrolase n=1 Tax=Marinimicrobium agarilyticum TaxID=306546 RepID=UPI00040034CE|nr:alpha/beta hydrolase [Marinimicrobium agarilyticum]
MSLSENAPDFSRLPALLPELHFDLERDARCQGDPQVRAYLKHYGLDMEAAFPDVAHRMGYSRVEGWDIAVQYWVPENPQGTFTIVHGYFDHSALYAQAVHFALERRLSVLAYDHPGHGLSSGERLVIDSFNRYADVLDALLQSSARLFSGPRYAFGQSMGGATLLNHLWRYGPALTGRTALFAPLVLPQAWGLSKWLYALLHRWVKEVPRTFTDSSHDDDFNDFLEHKDPLQYRKVSVEWVGAMKAWDETFRSWPVRDDELLIVQGTGDGTVDWQYNLQQIGRLLPNLRVEMITEARHHLVNESQGYRDPAFAAVADFFFGR